jgi:hypothetical protein
VHELLGWNIWSARAVHASVQVVRAGDHLEVLLAEDEVAAAADGASTGSRTRLLFAADGTCTAAHMASPSVMHVLHAGTQTSAAARDGSRSTVVTEMGDVLVATTAAFLQAAPAELLAQIPQRTRRRRSLAGLAEELVRRVGRSPAGDRAGIVVAQRVWPAGV